MKYAHEMGCKVSIITNGSKDVSEVLPYVDMLEFSVDAGNEKDYAKARPGLKWNILNENISKATELRKDTKLICSIINQKGIDVDAAVKYWDFLDHVQVRKFLSFNSEQDNSADDSPYLSKNDIPCPWLWDRILMNTKGEYTLCNIDVGFDFKFSDMNEMSIKQAWHGKEMSYMREMHRSGRACETKLCKDCKDRKYRTWNYSFFKLREYASSNNSA